MIDKEAVIEGLESLILPTYVMFRVKDMVRNLPESEAKVKVEKVGKGNRNSCECGRKLGKEDKYCPECGSKLIW